MSIERDLLKRCLDFMIDVGANLNPLFKEVNDVLLTQPEQEPVAWRYMYSVNNYYTIFQEYPQGLVDNGKIIEALYTSPQKTEQSRFKEREVSGKIISTDDACNWNLTVGALKDYDHVYVNGVRYVEFQPEQPEAWIVVNKETGYRTQVSHFPDSYDKNTFEVIPLYTAPPKRELLGDGITADMYRANKKATHPDSYWAGVNDAEKAYGIGVE